MYGLKQAPGVWHQTFTTYLFELGCVQSLSDGAPLTFSYCGGVVYFLLYADDVQIASQQFSHIAAFKQLLLSKFTGRDLGETPLFLQKSVQRDRARKIIVLKQERHIEKILKATGLDAEWPTNISRCLGCVMHACAHMHGCLEFGA